MNPELFCYYTGISHSSVDLLNKAMQRKYGTGVVGLKNIDPSELTIESRNACRVTSIVAFVVPNDLLGKCDDSLLSSEKLIKFSSFSSLKAHFEDEDIDLSDIVDTSAVESTDSSSSAPVIEATKEAVQRMDDSHEVYEFTLRELQNQITFLEGKLSEQGGSVPQGVLDQQKTLQEDLDKLQKRYDGLQDSYTQLEDSLANERSSRASKESELALYRDNFEDAVKNSTFRLQEEVRDLKSTIEVRDSEIAELQDSVDRHRQKIEEVIQAKDEIQTRYNELDDKYSEAQQKVIDMTQETIDLRRDLSLYDQSEDFSDSGDSNYELVSLRKKFNALRSDVFYQLSNFSDVSSCVSPQIPFVDDLDPDRVKFVFTGSDGAIKNTYRCLQRLAGEMSTRGKVIILDLCTESCLDYVFQPPGGVVSGIEWLSTGGQLEGYLTNTPNDNVKALTPGISYFNEVYLMSVRWDLRIRELLTSGWQVIIYGGPLAYTVGRVLYNTFCPLSEPIVVINGNLLSIRSVLLQTQGLARKPIVYVKTFETSARNLYQMLAQSHSVVRVDDVEGRLLDVH